MTQIGGLLSNQPSAIWKHMPQGYMTAHACEHQIMKISPPPPTPPRTHSSGTSSHPTVGSLCILHIVTITKVMHRLGPPWWPRPHKRQHYLTRAPRGDWEEKLCCVMKLLLLWNASSLRSAARGAHTCRSAGALSSLLLCRPCHPRPPTDQVNAKDIWEEESTTIALPAGSTNELRACKTVRRDIHWYLLFTLRAGLLLRNRSYSLSPISVPYGPSILSVYQRCTLDCLLAEGQVWLCLEWHEHKHTSMAVNLSSGNYFCWIPTLSGKQTIKENSQICSDTAQTNTCSLGTRLSHIHSLISMCHVWFTTCFGCQPAFLEVWPGRIHLNSSPGATNPNLKTQKLSRLLPPAILLSSCCLAMILPSLYPERLRWWSILR